MKKTITYLVHIIIFIIIGLSTMGAKAQKIAFSYKNDWSYWIHICGNLDYWWGDKLRMYYRTDMSSGRVSGIALKSLGGLEILSFKVDQAIMPGKWEKKLHMKTGEYFEFHGTVDYYVNDEYPTAEAFAKENRLVIPDPRHDKTPSVKRHAECTIKIAPYKNEPEEWCVFFDGIGIAISTEGLKK
jgi:hypothetical protein